MYWLCFVCDTLNEKHIHNDSKIYHSSEPPYRKYCTVCGTLNPIHNVTLSDHADSIIDGYCRLNSIIDNFPSNIYTILFPKNIYSIRKKMYTF